ncbi:Gfo/Idh/MocA family oxidoreductase [Caballeronia sp. LZ065]|uniref:Gfo/Idh/MocA family protein n=1 Tax=Caballeronia sp. LZ065 TaxID=3038571 RepID=UPI00285D6F67|nr:Gfo/Idh/MocA family oxidoreductase [Caballeronia sp. LZ065]MDR5781364.1 Gfo/Idh/MocA family oxidoreductase [Caballeronia sp. LZ065]
MTSLATLQQSWPMPAVPAPIVLIGAGGIARDAHLPAYREAGFEVKGVFDLDVQRAQDLARQWSIAQVHASLDEALDAEDVIFDIAAPAAVHASIVERVHDGAAVLLQKPFGLDLVQASRMRALCEAKGLKAAVNFQLRFAPMMLAVRDAIQRGLLGELVDVEVHLNLATPWHLFPHLKADPRVEVVSHSIHYLDLIRLLVGEPRGVMARGYAYPGSGLADTRTSAILDYGATLRCTLSLNHHHDFGTRFQDAGFRFEGLDGVLVVKLGALLDYPKGEPDELWFCARGGEWSQIALTGAWFPHAFIGTMANLQRYVSGEDTALVSDVADAWRTMALVEACYRSEARPAEPIPHSPA